LPDALLESVWLIHVLISSGKRVLTLARGKGGESVKAVVVQENNGCPDYACNCHLLPR